ncbi:STAS domain-containing protein [Streptomyces sp. NPDC006512]|uniref:STAS domain-containing protein n=1 Tax=Streptomyces sp. NPDC006512 TaxID=3154307 RepID=UPI0033AC73AB
MTGSEFMSHAVVQSGTARLTLVGQLDWDTAPLVRNAVAACLEERPTGLHLDLTGVTFCDCAGLNVLLGARTSAHAAGVDVVVAGIGAQLAHLLDVTGVGPVLTAPPGTLATPRGAGTAATAQSPLRDLLA